MGRNRILCFLFLLSLSVHGTSSIRILNTIRDLADNNIEFGKTPPRHGLKLLFWLAHHMTIDQNDVMQLENMDISEGDYGFHRFWNKENIFSPGPNEHLYTVGSLGIPTPRKLPPYVTEDFRNNQNTKNPDRNRDRIVVQTFRNTPARVRRLYITQHPRNQNIYDEHHTYEISPQLIKEIQNIPSLEEFLRQAGHSSGPVDNHQSNFKGNPPNNPPGGEVGGGTVKREASLEKSKTQKKHSGEKQDVGTGSCNSHSHTDHDAAEDLTLEMGSSEMGQSWITWSKSLLVLVVLTLISAAWLGLNANPPVNQVRVQPLVSQ